MKRRKKKWLIQIILIIGLVWKWMPVWVVRDGNGVREDESN